jgi:hypothetical protein
MTCGTSLTAIRVLPPAAERRLEIPPDVASQYPTCNDTVYVASVTFTDGAGNRWEGDPRRALNQRSKGPSVCGGRSAPATGPSRSRRQRGRSMTDDHDAVGETEPDLAPKLAKPGSAGSDGTRLPE